MYPTTQKIIERVSFRSLLLVALLTATAGIAPSQTASPCLATQLSARHERDDNAMGGRVSEYYSFRNNSKSPCTLKGSPSVVLIDRAGRQIKTKVVKGNPDSIDRGLDQPKTVALTPGGKAFFAVDYISCGVANQFVDEKSRCRSSAELGFIAPGTKGMVTIRESIDPAGWPELSGVSPVVASLKEFGFEENSTPEPKSKPKPKP